jgi:antitoxin ParD1/3/4
LARQTNAFIEEYGALYCGFLRKHLRGFLAMSDQSVDLPALDAAIARGLADLEAGRAKPASVVFDRLERKYDAMVEDKRR